MTTTTPILLTFQDGTVGVMHFVLSDDFGFTQRATNENIQRDIDKTPWASPVTSWKKITMADIPNDRTFRNAWVDNGGIQVDMPKARDIHRNTMRTARKPKLEALDRAYIRADEANDQVEKDRIMDDKQALRDVTADPGIEDAKTPETLKDVWPEILNKNQ